MARNIWDPYPLWNCAMGGNDNLGIATFSDKTDPRASDPKLQAFAAKERRALDAVYNSGKPCYRQLFNVRDYKAGEGDLNTSPLNILTDNLYKIQFERLFRILMQKPEFAF